MPRPRKNRVVNSMPSCEGFTPLGYICDSADCCPSVIMTVDEYETIRLIDFMKLTQQECAEQMQVSRPTVTHIYESARFKLADALINEKQLMVGGGDYHICHENIAIGAIRKEKYTMKIAVTYENDQIFQHFGRCENFKIYQVEDGTVRSSSVENAAGSSHGALAGFLKGLGADVLICGGIGGGAQNALTEAGIKFYGGVSGSADEAVQALLAGTLEYNANVQCSGHGHEHNHGHEHSCGHTCHK